MTKPEWRRALLAARAGRSPERFAELSPLPLLASVRLVASYVPMRSEPDPSALVPPGVAVCLPCLPPAGRVLRFRSPNGRFVPAARGGFLEPDGDEVPLEAIEAFLVPGLAFTAAGGRLGRGGGYYDATLAAHPSALRIGLCAAEELVTELPLEAHDALVDRVVAGARLVEVSPRRAR